MVIRHEHTKRREGLHWRNRLGRRRVFDGFDDARKPDGELTSLARSFARRGHRPAVHLDERLHQREPDTEPALRAVDWAVGLDKEVEDVWEHLSRDANTVILHG